MPDTPKRNDTNETKLESVVEEKDNNCYLSDIKYSCGFLSPDFDKEVYSYTLFIPEKINTKTIEISPILESNKATVSSPYKKNLSEISSSDYVTFTVTAENLQTKTYSINISRYDRKVVLNYSWSLDTKQVTITNLSKTKSYYILATSYPVYENGKHNYALLEIDEILGPSETKVLNAYVPTNLGAKPSILFSTEQDTIYEYSPAQSGQGIDHFIEILFLDYRETYNGEIQVCSEMYSIYDQEDKYGDSSTFTWTNRNKGQYKITGTSSKKLMKAYVGNIRGVTHAGDTLYLPAIQYYIGEKTKWNEWNNSL